MSPSVSEFFPFPPLYLQRIVQLPIQLFYDKKAAKPKNRDSSSDPTCCYNLFLLAILHALGFHCRKLISNWTELLLADNMNRYHGQASMERQ
jgi:hypothetical protein